MKINPHYRAVILNVMTHPSNSFSTKVQRYTDLIQAGDLNALSGLFDVTGVRLVRYATGITGNQHDGEDIVQSVLAKIATNPHLISQRDCSWSYLLRMTRNAAIDLTRKRNRNAASSRMNNEIAIVNTTDKMEVDTKQIIWIAIHQLPRNQREVILLKIWEQMTFEQIATVLELSIGTVASRYRYAINKLRHGLASISVERTRHEIRS